MQNQVQNSTSNAYGHATSPRSESLQMTQIPDNGSSMTPSRNRSDSLSSATSYPVIRRDSRDYGTGLQERRNSQDQSPSSQQSNSFNLKSNLAKIQTQTVTFNKASDSQRNKSASIRNSGSTTPNSGSYNNDNALMLANFGKGFSQSSVS